MTAPLSYDLNQLITRFVNDLREMLGRGPDDTHAIYDVECVIDNVVGIEITGLSTQVPYPLEITSYMLRTRLSEHWSLAEIRRRAIDAAKDKQ